MKKLKSIYPHKILMTADAVGGVWTYMVDLAKALTSCGCEVHVAVMGPVPTAEMVTDLESLGITVYTKEYQLEWMDDPWSDVKAAGFWLMQLQDKINPDIVHLNNYCHGHLNWHVPVVMVAHSCVLSWWQAVKGCVAPAMYRTYFNEVKKGLEAANLVIAPTQHMLHEIEKIYQLKVPSAVIPNASGFKPAGNKTNDYALCMGRLWDEAKNIVLVDEAAALQPWEVITAGRAKENQFKQLLPVGWCNPQQIQKLYAHAAIFVSPAKYEPFGLAILEAAIAGCALVLGDIPSLHENWEGAAIFTDTDDPVLLASVLQMLAEDPDLLHQYQLKAKICAAKFSIKKMTETYLYHYQQLLIQHQSLKPQLA